MLLADIATAETGTAEIFFLIAVILFVLYALLGYRPLNDTRLHSVLLGLGLACVAFGLLLL